MGAYPSAASQIRLPRDPVEGIRNVVSLRGMMQQQDVAQQDAQTRAQQAQQDAQLRAQQIQRGQAAQQDQDVWRKAYQDNEGDPDKTMAQAIKSGASAGSIEAFQRHQAGLKLQLAQKDEMELRNLGTKYNNLRKVMEPLVDEISNGTDVHQGQGGEGAGPDVPSQGRIQNPVTMRGMMLGKGGEWQGEPSGRADHTQQKQELWSKQREIVLAHPEAYGISDVSQIPIDYPGDDSIRNLYATLAGGQRLVRQDLARRQANAPPESTGDKSPTRVWIRQKGEWVPYYER